MIHIPQTDTAWVIGTMPFEVALGPIANAGNKRFILVPIFDFEKSHFVAGVYDRRQNTLYTMDTMQSDQRNLEIRGYGITGIMNWLRTGPAVSNELVTVVNVRVTKQIDGYMCGLLAVENYRAFFREPVEDWASPGWRNPAFELGRDWASTSLWREVRFMSETLRDQVQSFYLFAIQMELGS